MSRSSLFISLIASLTLTACGGATGGAGGSGGAGSASSASGSGGSASTTSSSSGGGGSATTSSSSSSGSATTSSSSGGSMPVASCSEINAVDCFSNLDCMVAERCENKGTPELSVPCCVPGPRGTGKQGEACAIDNDCDTSLCVETPNGYQCSGECTSDADCTADMPTCVDIPASIGKGSFCLPA